MFYSGVFLSTLAGAKRSLRIYDAMRLGELRFAANSYYAERTGSCEPPRLVYCGWEIPPNRDGEFITQATSLWSEATLYLLPP